MRALLVTFGCALAARLTQLWALSSTPYLDGLSVDALGFEEDARTLAALGSLPEAFIRPPLYIYIRAAFGLIGMDGTRTLSVIHCLLGALTASLVALATWRLSAPEASETRLRATWIAGLITAFYGPLIAGDLELLASVWVEALLALSLVLLATPPEFGSRAEAPASTSRLRVVDGLGGLSLGLAITGWGPAAAFALPLAMLRLRGLAFRKGAPLALVLLAAASVAPTLSAVHNAAHGAPGTVISANLGLNLWLGNNPRWQATWAAGPGLYFDREESLPLRAGRTSLSARDRWFVEAVWRGVQDDPAGALLRTLQKLGCALHGTEISRDHHREWIRDHSPLVAATWFGFGIQFPFGLLLPLALLCPRQCLRPGAYVTLLAGALGYALLLAVFFVAMRYRVLLVLLLAPLAAHACAVRARGATPLQWSAGVLALVACNLPNALSERVGATPVQELVRLRQSFKVQQNSDAALACSLRAVELNPDDADARVALGIDLLERGEARQALQHFEHATRQLPDSEAAWHYFAHANSAVDRPAQAIASFERALAINPYHASSHRDLARTQLALGELLPALASLRRAQRAGYWDPECADALAHALLARGHTAEASELVRELERRSQRSRS